MKKRLLAVVLVFVMLLAWMPTLGVVPVSAEPATDYWYKLQIKTRDESNAGTDSEIHAGFKLYTGTVYEEECDISDYNDFERGDDDSYLQTHKCYPWMIEHVYLKHNGGGIAPDWKPGRVKVWLPKIDGTTSNSSVLDVALGRKNPFTNNGSSVGSVTFSGTMEKGDTKTLSIAELTRRNFTSVGEFNKWDWAGPNSNGTIYVGDDTTGTFSLSWDGTVTDQYGTYNIFAYDDPAKLEISNSFNTGTTSMFINAFKAPTSDKAGGLSLTYQEIYNEMKAKGIGKATLKFTLSVPARSSNPGDHFNKGDSYHTHVEQVVIYRKCFDIGKVSYSETPVFTARKDNDYLNSAKKNVTITVSPTELHCSSSISDSEIKMIVTNFSCNAELYSGNGTSVKLADLSYAPSSDGKKIVFTGSVPANFTSNGAGVNLHLTNVSTKYNGVKYLLNSGSTTWDHYISTLKVDTQKPTVSITDKDGIGLDISNELARTHTFYLSGSETLYKSNTAPHPADDEAFVNYSLLYDGTKIPVNNYNGTTGSYLNVTVPVSTAVLEDMPITLKTATASEGVYTLAFDGYDDAGNPISNNKVENVLIDSVAPRYTLVESKSYQDAQKIKQVEYNFTLADLCNSYKDTLGSWSRLYYVFVPNGQEIPEFDADTITGEIATTIGRWNFIEADENGELPTILISIGLKDNFEGDLYLLSKDSVGNATQVIKFASDLKIYNFETTDTIETSANLVPAKSFDISFKETVSGIDGIYKTEYRWVPVSATAEPITQSYIVYDGQDVGAGVQRGDDGNEVILNGTYKLEYKVTEIRSGNTVTFEKNYVFDNLAPTIDVFWESVYSEPQRIQQATIVIEDVTGVENAAYKIYTNDDELVGEGVLTPTVSGDGKIGVRESIKLQPKENGVYYLVVTAVDINGDKEVYTAPDSFSIRANKPTIASAGDDISVKNDGISVTSSQDYTVYLQVLDNMLCADSLASDQFVKYQVSKDGINYGPWTTLDVPMDVSDSYISSDAEIESPVTLTEGENTLYFKVACAEKGNTAEPAVSLVSDVYAYRIIYDTTAPSFDVEYSTSAPTREDVTVTITANDANGVTELSLSNSRITVEKESDVKYVLTVKRNVDTYAVLSDIVGNEVNVPVCVTCIDKDAPLIFAQSEAFESGERTDVNMRIIIEDANSVITNFALVKDPDSDSIIDEDAFNLYNQNKSKFTVEKSTVNGATEYNIILRGLDGNYGIGVMSTDMLGNTFVLRPENNAFDIVDATASIVSNVSAPEITKSIATVSLEFNVPLSVLNPTLATGNDDSENEQIAANQSVRNYVSSITRTASDNLEQKIYAVDEANRTYTLTFASDAMFIEGFKLVYELYKNGEIIENGSFISFEEEDDIELVVTSNPQYELQTFDISKAVLNGYIFNSEKSEIYVPEDVEETDGDPVYTKLVFDALHDGSTEKSVSFRSYTAEGNEDERYQDELINTLVFDETAPTISFNADIDNDTPTNNNVTVNATFGDAESGIASVERIVDDGDYELLGEALKDSIEFEENGSVTYIVTNNVGLSYEKTYTVTNIDKTPITENEHYTVSYYYENYLGRWKPVNEGNYYRAVKAIIRFTDSDKELSVTNNGTQRETILTKEKSSFTFEIADSAGNTTTQDVSYELYDNDGGNIEWSLSNYNKTNKPVTAFVTIADKDGVNEIVYAEVRDAAGELIEWSDEVLGNEYSLEISLSGNYTVTAYDAAGNEFSTLITVSNIDTVKPEITRLSYSVPPTTITTRSVLVKIEEFSKSNVTVTGIERSDSLGQYDIVYTPGATEIRFKKSGYVSVFYVDDYGNEGASVISVSNIYTEPPALEAVATLAEDELSVEISFVKQLDENGMPVDIYRELSDLSVVYDGVTYTTDKTFTVKQNGDYKFTVFDQSGTAQTINLTVTGIDDRAPVIKTVSWSYEYLEENGGVWEEKYFEKTLEIGKDTSGTEAGYTVGPDIHNITNRDVTVTIVTDKDTSILGSNDIKSKANSLIYAENGLFTFNLAAINGTVSSYGVDVEIIDKEAPTLTFEGANELIFIEGMTNGRDPEFAYDKSRFYDFEAYDVFQDVRTDLTDRVVIDFGEFNPDDISANVFDRTKPYNITYTVYDDAGNKTELRRTVRLIGFYDTIALINGKMPNSANAITVDTDDIEISLKNFGGTAYAKLAKGIYTMGQMKTQGTPVNAYNGRFVSRDLENGWYTVFVQTDKRDYFTITVYVDAAQ
ncbi:MAG: hypothetical protein J6V93_04885 [Clostridia bacterium]|nr:hypothetical protein [Clostridia bacterium]